MVNTEGESKNLNERLDTPQIEQAIELVEEHYKLHKVPVEDALPLFGLSRILKLGKLSCLNPWTWKFE
jgi:hypothetical protein